MEFTTQETLIVILLIVIVANIITKVLEEIFDHYRHKRILKELILDLDNLDDLKEEKPKSKPKRRGPGRPKGTKNKK